MMGRERLWYLVRSQPDHPCVAQRRGLVIPSVQQIRMSVVLQLTGLIHGTRQ